ncbi:hypothetical protein [Luteibacter rhizovicinus]|uniref:hypothetical protein n=1 Tax=Luteibacter rhizovicinus TaxID=242606 RepID=UPI00065A0A73|nr:hypothetical protein [Luteibacter rhizovicinus]KLD75321.1 hypothetical protein Y886_27670 [Xanthomonas hyacinthi DSM 19077]
MNAYKHLALRMALIALLPAAVYAYTVDWWTGIKVYIAFTISIQPIIAWLFRQDIARAWRKRRGM